LFVSHNEHGRTFRSGMRLPVHQKTALRTTTKRRLSTQLRLSEGPLDGKDEVR